MRKRFFFLIAICFAAATLAEAGEPATDLRRGIDEGLKILRDPAFLDAAAKAEQQAQLIAVAKRVFDYQAFSRLVLASGWQDFTEEQRSEFISRFSKFLSLFYMTRLQEKYTDETVIIGAQQMLSSSRARVDVDVIWQGRAIPVEVMMIRRKERWKVYDLQALGVSAVANYRAQFFWLLLNMTPDDVIERLREKIASLEKQP
jgi:ABC-type transporter MlaC component